MSLFYLQTHQISLFIFIFNLVSLSFASIAGKSCHLCILQGSMKTVIFAKDQLGTRVTVKTPQGAEEFLFKERIEKWVDKLGATYFIVRM